LEEIIIYGVEEKLDAAKVMEDAEGSEIEEQGITRGV
jgi:hypothetical protein